MIYGFLTGRGPQWAVECGAAHGALAMTTPGDTTMATLAEVERVMKGGTARVCAMTKSEVIKQIKDTGVIPVVRATSADEAMRAIDAIREGGISVLEITMTVPGAVECDRTGRGSLRKRCVGWGRNGARS